MENLPTLKWRLTSLLQRLSGLPQIDMNDKLYSALGLTPAALRAAVEQEFFEKLDESVAFVDEPYTTPGDLLGFLEFHLGPDDPKDAALTCRQFIGRYWPEVTPEGDYFRQREWVGEDRDEIVKAIEENRCWTAVSGDEGEFYVVWGNRTVNRLYNIITARPVEHPDHAPFYQDEDDVEDADSEREEATEKMLFWCNQAGSLLKVPSLRGYDIEGFQRKLASVLKVSVADVECMRLRDDECHEGIYFDWGLVNADGAWFRVMRLPYSDPAAVERCKAKIRRDRDVVTMRVHHIKYLVEIDPEGDVS